jgi:hypothetical protein
MLELETAAADLVSVLMAERADVVLVGAYRCLGSCLFGMVRVALFVVRMVARSACVDRSVPDIGDLDRISSVDSWVASA